MWNCGMDEGEEVRDTLEVAVVELEGYRVFLPVVIRIDAWWNPYIYRVKGISQFELRSAGPDGRIGTADDLVRN